MSAQYPAFLRLDGRLCVVIGGGKVAARKVRGLRKAGARIRMVAPEAVEELSGLAESGQLEWRRRSANVTDLEGATLVFLASSDSALHDALARAARAVGALVNRADVADEMDFTVPAVARRGGITAAVSSGARSPAFARQLREDLETLITPERIALLEVMGEARERLAEQGVRIDGERWHAAIDEEIRGRIGRGEVRLAVDYLVQRLTADEVTAR